MLTHNLEGQQGTEAMARIRLVSKTAIPAKTMVAWAAVSCLLAFRHDSCCAQSHVQQPAAAVTFFVPHK